MLTRSRPTIYVLKLHFPIPINLHFVKDCIIYTVPHNTRVDYEFIEKDEWSCERCNQNIFSYDHYDDDHFFSALSSFYSEKTHLNFQKLNETIFTLRKPDRIFFFKEEAFVCLYRTNYRSQGHKSSLIFSGS